MYQQLGHFIAKVPNRTAPESMKSLKTNWNSRYGERVSSRRALGRERVAVTIVRVTLGRPRCADGLMVPPSHHRQQAPGPDPENTLFTQLGRGRGQTRNWVFIPCRCVILGKSPHPLSKAMGLGQEGFVVASVQQVGPDGQAHTLQVPVGFQELPVRPPCLMSRGDGRTSGVYSHAFYSRNLSNCAVSRIFYSLLCSYK